MKLIAKNLIAIAVFAAAVPSFADQLSAAQTELTAGHTARYWERVADIAADAGNPDQQAASALIAQNNGSSSQPGRMTDTQQDSAIKGLQTTTREHELRIDGLVQVDKDQQTAIDGKVDKTTYENDKVRQSQTDSNQDSAIADNKAAIMKNHSQQAAINAALATRVTTTENNKADKTALMSEQAAREKGDSILDGKIEANSTEIAKNQSTADTRYNNQVAINSHVQVQIQDNKTAQEKINSQQARNNDVVKGQIEVTNVRVDETRTDLANGLAQKVDTGVFQQRAADLQSRIDSNKADQQKVNSQMAGRIENHEGRIADLEKRGNKQFSELKSQIDRNEKKANAGTSAALAATGIPQVMADQSFALGAAVGGYEGESALAVGLSARATKNVTVKASVSTDTQSGVGYAAGVSVGW